MILILMGVAGSGKTTLGELLSAKNGFPFIEADSLHPENNIKKMSSGIPLNDEDRIPWLQIIHSKIKDYLDSGQNAIFTCSALKKSYRRILKGDSEEVYFVYLKSPANLIEERMSQRKGHFMPVSLLKNQLETLEEPGPDEALTLDNSKDSETVLNNLMNYIKTKKIIS